MEKLKKIGFFHFGENDKVDPISSLRKSLTLLKMTSPRLSDCLLVLPEAFNVRGGYYGRDHPDASIRSDLKQISAETNIAFVAGLIEPCEGSTLGCNSAYLIDGACCRLLSRKRQYTRGEGAYTLYRPCQFDDDPIAHRGLRIAALVCADADSDADCFQDRRASFLKSTKALKTVDPIVLCVPACITNPYPEAIVDCWPEPAAMVIANSAPGRSSVIRIQSKTKLELADRQNNTIKIEAFPFAVSN